MKNNSKCNFQGKKKKKLDRMYKMDQTFNKHFPHISQHI